MVVCDLCGKPGTLQKWKVYDMTRGESVTSDLCEKHAAPVKAIFDTLRKEAPPRRSRPVLTEAQVKAQRRKKKPQ